MLSSGYFLFPSNMKVFCLSLLLDSCGKNSNPCHTPWPSGPAVYRIVLLVAQMQSALPQPSDLELVLSYPCLLGQVPLL